MTPILRLPSLHAAYVAARTLETKAAFHTGARAALVALATFTGGTTSSYRIRSQKLGGPGVLGATTLHNDNLYVNLGEEVGEYAGILYRTCRGRLDFEGGPSHWLRYAEIERLPEAIVHLLGTQARRAS
jgi:hypothetical protein